ncbi:MAG TPA: ribosome biogenesis GTPase Der [Candidatus Krumholzibacteriaceae bacterium]|nr:ribosome biogenesis GTPase Der [Candidatus Krumholzibacteriaceae bacterium]
MKQLSSVAIIGKPNSGKSTLFNRIVGGRKAITHAAPGVTRDTMREKTSWNGKEFTVVDTGGFDSEGDDALQHEIRKRIVSSAVSAEVIIFLADLKTGPTSEDMLLLKSIRKLRNKIICVVNKVESTNDEIESNDFYSLGFSRLFTISALHGRGIGDMLDEVVSRLQPEDTFHSVDDDIIKIDLIGKPNVGKSSIVNKLIGKEENIVSEEQGTTRDTINLRFKYYGKDVVVTDTAGIRRKSRKSRGLEGLTSLKSERSVGNADIVLAVIDVSNNRITKQDIKVISIAHKARKGIIILLNKWDLVDKTDLDYQTFKKVIHKSIPFVEYAPIITVSAKTGTRIGAILPKCFEIQGERIKKIPTPEFNKFLNKVTSINPPGYYKGGIGKIFYGTQTDIKPPTFTLFVNNPSYFPRSYRRYINNQLRKVFTFEGTAVRIRFRSREH